jgi:hypothetical protein
MTICAAARNADLQSSGTGDFVCGHVDILHHECVLEA